MDLSVSDNNEERKELLRKFARDAPIEPGVYLWRDEENNVIYVGKAKALRHRLSSYFSGEKDPKTAALIKRAERIETIIVANEYEALLLENTLIKQYSPKYNINLKDGKTYPVIRITSEEFPRVFKTRYIVEDGSLYFGPFTNIQAVETVMAMVERLFYLRKCRVFRKRDNPCMYYHIKRCCAPCCDKISARDYRTHVKQVEKILSGDTTGLIIDLTKNMHEAAAALNFERASELRDTIRAIETLQDSASSMVVDMDENARDYIASASEGVLTTFTVFSMRGGKMIGRDLFRTRSAAEEKESVETFLMSYYNPSVPPPSVIYIETISDGNSQNSGKTGGDSLKKWFVETFGYAPSIQGADDRRHAAVLAMARQNAQEDLRKRLKERGAGPALEETMQALRLNRLPVRIEGFDIAQLDGKHPVASLISFKNGVPDRKNYRIFKLRTVIGIVDDFAAMREAVHRRYSRLAREGKDLPDLILIDGGLGQVNAVQDALDELGVDCDIVGLAKRDEELWLPGSPEPIRLSRRSEALKLLQFVRDETHRFATSFNQKLRSEDICFSVLENVAGIGAKKASAIMKAFISLERVAAASVEAIAKTCGIKPSLAHAVKTAASLSLADREAAKKRLTSGDDRSKAKVAGNAAGKAVARQTGASLAAEAAASAAAEAEPDYFPARPPKGKQSKGELH
ncbi:MAG: excinuclease ABC subunit UvrC [Treponema sp.]|jgi:excinuclease ABC subunit C|nr:excinuclease ABC subunit UvrC [Treponema sp.]